MIVMVVGLPGCGKSYFAIRLARQIKADYISSDRIRNEIIHDKTYSENEKRIVYQEMLTRMLKALDKNRDVVLDATFYTSSLRKQFAEAGKGNKVLCMEIVADEHIIKERLSKRRTDSDADFEVYKKVKQQWELLKEPCLQLQSTNNNIQQMLSDAINYLRQNHDNRRAS